MTPIVEPMTVPDPAVCTHEEWDAYLESVDLSSLSWPEADAHRRLVDAYTLRLTREQAAAHRDTMSRLDARDEAERGAEILSARCRELNTALTDLGDEVLRVRAEGKSPAEAQARYDEVAAKLSIARAALSEANLRAIVARINAR